MIALITVLATIDPSMPTHPMPQTYANPEFDSMGLKVVEPGAKTYAYLLSAHYRQNYSVHLVFSKTFPDDIPMFFFKGDAKSPVSMQVRKNTVDLVFGQDFSRVSLQKNMKVDEFNVSVSWQLEDPAWEFYEQEHANYVNDYRVNKGLSKLYSSQRLNEIARVKARDMFFNAYNHNSPIYGTPQELLSFFQYTTAGASGENIEMTEGFYWYPQKSFLNFRISADHHRNIVNPEFKAFGVGFAYYYNKMYIVEIFSSVIETDEHFGYKPRVVLPKIRPVNPVYTFAGGYADPLDTNDGERATLPDDGTDPDSGNTTNPDPGNTTNPDPGNTTEPDSGNTTPPEVGPGEPSDYNPPSDVNKNTKMGPAGIAGVVVVVVGVAVAATLAGYKMYKDQTKKQPTANSVLDDLSNGADSQPVVDTVEPQAAEEAPVEPEAEPVVVEVESVNYV